MPYEDPIEAALRALTDVEWTRRDEGVYTAQINRTHLAGIEQSLADHRIDMRSEPSATRSGRYVAIVAASEIPRIQQAVKDTGVHVKPQRRKG